MEGEKVKALFRDLAMSQGFYGRLLEAIESRADAKEIYEQIGEGCSNAVDVVMKVEG